MKVLCFGSLNVDHVYQVPHAVQPGETLSVAALQKFPGGKGLNQSIALCRAGMDVWFAGKVGTDGRFLSQLLSDTGVHTELIGETELPSGHAIIQVDEQGQNCILLYGGANQCMDQAYIEQVIDGFEAGDVIICQNEVNMMEEITRTAVQKGMRLALNPSPFDQKMTPEIIGRASWLYINEVESEVLTGIPAERTEETREVLLRINPSAEWILTLGAKGAYSIRQEGMVYQPAFRVQAEDTTGAGDTFSGYHLAAALSGLSTGEALRRAACASAIAVTRAGASSSIPCAT